MFCFSSVPAAHGKDHPLNPEVVGPVTTDELEQEERELTSKAEEECRVEEHRRMLARHLEYQRQIENESKQKCLAKPNKAGNQCRECGRACAFQVNKHICKRA